MRERARRGAPEQSINGPLVRVTWLLVLPAVLLAAFTVSHPGPLPAPPIPPSFDRAAALGTATGLAREHPSRVPGTALAASAASWYEERLALYGLETSSDVWDAELPGLGRVRLRNIVTVVPGESDDTILFVANRDNNGTGPGANANASGTAVLLALASGYADVSTVTGRPRPRHTLVFLSSDGGAYGGYGAERFAAVSPLRDRLVAVVSLDALGGNARPRLAISGTGSRSPTAALVRTTSVRVAEQTTRPPVLPDWLTQVVNLAIPFGYGEQAPFLARGISAVRLTTLGDGAAARTADASAALNVARFERLGRSAEALLSSLDASVTPGSGTSAAVHLGGRTVRGWAIQLVLLASLVPYLVGTIDFLVRSRTRRLPLRGAWLALRTPLGVWLWIGAVAAIGALAGVFPRRGLLPAPPGSPVLPAWADPGLLALLALCALGFLQAHRSSARRPRASERDELAAYGVALAALGCVAIAVALVNPYALVFVAPSLYAWLWLPQLRGGPGWRSDLLFGLGLGGPAIGLVVITRQLELGSEGILYVASLATAGFVPWPLVVAFLAWAATATYLGSLVTGRHRPGSEGGVEG